MSSPIWTAAALSFETRPYAGTAWRLVEAQHVVSTQALVDTLDEQAALEALLERTKPPVPSECRHLDYLLYTPFRYGSYPRGSRFRKAGRTPGVFYAAEHVETAVAETAHYRMLFYRDAPGVSPPQQPAQFTAISVVLETESALDLTAPPLDRDTRLWTDPDDYSACQDFADTARAANANLIRYQSVRDPAARANLAVLTCACFAEAAPSGRQSWHIRATASRAWTTCEHPRQALEFGD